MSLGKVAIKDFDTLLALVCDCLRQADDFGLELSLVDSLEQTLNYCEVVGMSFELVIAELSPQK